MNEYCEANGKVKYKSPQEAYKYGRKMQKNRGGNVRAYVCEFCGAYHLTHKHEFHEKRRKLHKRGE